MVFTGFRDWKDAIGKSGILTTHGDSCIEHHQTVLSSKQYHSTIVSNSSVAIQIERGRRSTIEDNRIYVKSIIESILFFCQQELALRGHREVLNSKNMEETWVTSVH